jgi:hypothetical protein
MARPGRCRSRVCCVVLLGAAAVTACGTDTIKPSGAAKAVVDVVSRQTGFHPTDVKCPSGIAAKVGGTFDCHFTGPGGQPYTASMRIVSIKGSRVDFFVSTRPT